MVSIGKRTDPRSLGIRTRAPSGSLPDGSRRPLSEERLERRRVGGRGGDEHQEKAEQEGPEGHTIRPGGELLLSGRRAPAGRHGLPGDRHRATLGRGRALEATGRTQRHRLGGRALEAAGPARYRLIILPQRAGTGGLHRLSFSWPAGLADGLAPKESRYAGKHPGDSPLAMRPFGSPVPPVPVGASAGWTAACYQGSRAAGRKNARKLRGPSRALLPGDLGNVDGHVLSVAPLEQPRGHPPLTRPADLDRREDALLRDLADPIEVGARDAARVDGVEVVAAGADGPEELLAALLLGVQTGPLEVSHAALVLAARGDHHGGHRHTEPDVEERDQDAEPSAAA